MWDNLKASIASVVRTNNNQEITGANLQSVLSTIVNTVGANATFAGIAVPSTNPGTPDGPIFYIACEPGVYSNFNLTLVDGLYILENKTGSWVGTQINTGAAFEALIGYYNAVLNGASITVPEATTYRLTKGGVVRLKMLAPGTTATTLTIGNAADIPIWYNGAVVSEQNTWEANEIISVFYDGTRFMASNSQGGGGKFSTGELLKNVPITNAVTANSNGLITSGGVYKDTPSNANNTATSDLDIMDEAGNVLVRFSGGGVKTKCFDSSKMKVEIDDDNFSDLDVVDENGYVLVRFYDGNIKTKNFDSKKYEDGDFNHWKGKKWYGFGTSITNVSREGKYATYLAQISKMTFVNKGHSGGGITTSSNQTIYNDIMQSDLSDADLITLECGANDEGAALGSVYDGLPNSSITDNSTLCGALNLCIRHLQASTNAQVVVMCSPSSRRNVDASRTYYGNETRGSDNHTELERNQAIRQVCMLNSCYFIGAGCEDGMGFARLNSTNNYNTDHIHQSDLGGYNFAQAIWSKLKNIPLFYTSIP